MSAPRGFLRRHAAAGAALLAIAGAYQLARSPEASAEERRVLAAHFAFARFELPALDQPQRTQRDVHPQLARLRAWISSVGAAVAFADLDGDDLPNDLCLVDPRVDEVLVMPVPATGDRYPLATLDPAPLPYDRATMAPMGCLPGDLDEDGSTDVLVYYWGRTPIAFLRRGSAFVAHEIVDRPERWHTNACTRADVDGDGHIDLIFGNYFPDDARVLDAAATNSSETMHESMALAANGGRNRVLLWQESAAAELVFRDASDSLPAELAQRWTLAIGAADLDGDLLPELYFANDFGPDVLLHNRSTAGAPAFAPLEGRRTLTAAKSCVLGHDSFKGMGVDFGDLNDDGRPDIYVSNITAEWGLQETQLCFLSTGATADMQRGVAPYVNRAEGLGLARTGWAWESKLGDFDNDGVLEALQATGFVRGRTTRWPELHEIAMANDLLLAGPENWHWMRRGDDLSGSDPNPFFVRGANGRYVDVAPEVGLDDRAVSRGIATADVDGDGDLDLAVANQWGPSVFWRNDAPDAGSSLGLRLRLQTRRGATRPAIGACAEVRRADGRLLTAQVDGGNGHSGVRSAELHFGLGRNAGSSVEVAVRWRDTDGAPHETVLSLEPGRHTVRLAAGEQR